MRGRADLPGEQCSGIQHSGNGLWVHIVGDLGAEPNRGPRHHPNLPRPAAGVRHALLWPGLQPDGPGANDQPLDNGVLQPVLTWGPTCAPNAPDGDPYGSWWILSAST